MPSFLQIEHISKSYGPKVLFEDIAFNINEGDKIALIAPNGTGKTTLMKILAGQEKSDRGGSITFLKDIRIAFLPQDSDFDPDKTILEEILSKWSHIASDASSDSPFEYETEVRRQIGLFSLGSPDRKMSTLSGGEAKRVAIAGMFSTGAEFLIMDEPTNHLDIDAVEMLEKELGKSRRTLLMVTHDRYFLDRVCNTVMELDRGGLYIYRGDYENYLEKRQERIDNYNSETEKVKNILRRELEWMRSTPCARSGKAKYRKDAFYQLKDRAEDVRRESTLSFSGVPTGARLGSKVINCKHLSFFYGGECYLDDFNYNFAKGEKIGIVGENGVGKSTFLNILCGEIPDDGISTLTGEIDRGESLKIGYYRQRGGDFDPNASVLDIIGDISLLGRFLFTHDMLDTRYCKLSGGEKRRLYLLSVLVQNPNLLILDEPTNDLDIVTLNILEEYLQEFSGNLLVVSHDRHFLDRITDHLFILSGGGRIKDFAGKFSEYRDYIAQTKAASKNEQAAPPASTKAVQRQRRLSFKEKRELLELETSLSALTEEKRALESSLSAPDNMDFAQIQRMSERLGALQEEMDLKELRWLELSEIEESAG